MILGYTSGGFPYGLTHEEMNEIKKVRRQNTRLKLMRSKWQKFKILQAINYFADRQERSFESRTSLSPKRWANWKKST